ncbi:hypothetical protein L5515_008344, partial [Caenorhabditis briggsae]
MEIKEVNKKLSKKGEKESASSGKGKKGKQSDKSALSVQEINESMKKEDQHEEAEVEKSAGASESDQTGMSIQDMNKTMKKKDQKAAVTGGKSGKSKEEDSDKLAIQEMNTSLKKQSGSADVTGTFDRTESEKDEFSEQDFDVKLAHHQESGETSQNLDSKPDAEEDSLSLQSLKKKMEKTGESKGAELKLGESKNKSDSFSLQDLYEELKSQNESGAEAETSKADMKAEKTSMEVKDVKKKLKKKQGSGAAAESSFADANKDETSLEIRDIQSNHGQGDEKESTTFNFGAKDQEEYSMEVKNMNKRLARQDAEEIQSGKTIPTVNEEKTGLAVTGKNKKLKKGSQNESAEIGAEEKVSTSATDSFAESTLRSKKAMRGDSDKSEANIAMKNRDELSLATTSLEDNLEKTGSADDSEAEHLVALKNKEKTSLAMRKKRVSFDSSTKSESIEDVIPEKNKEADQMSITGMKKKLTHKAESAEVEKNEAPEVKEKALFEEKTLKSKKKSRGGAKDESVEKNLGEKVTDQDSLEITGKNKKLGKAEESGKTEKSVKVPQKTTVTTSFAEQSLTSELDKFLDDEEMAEMMLAEDTKASDLMNVLDKNQEMKKKNDEETHEISLQSKLKEKHSLSSIDKQENLKKSGKRDDKNIEASKTIDEKDHDTASYREVTKNIKKSKKGDKDLSSEATLDQKNLGETQYAEVSSEDKIQKTGESENIEESKLESSEGSAYAEVSRNRKFKKTEQIGGAEASLKQQSDEKRQDSLSVSDVNPELRRSGVEISAFGQIDLTAEDATSLADIQKNAHLTKKKKSDQNVSKNLKDGSKTDSDSLSIANQHGSFGKNSDSGEASATVEQQGEEKIAKKVNDSEMKKPIRGETGSDFGFENHEEPESTETTIEASRQDGKDSYSDQRWDSSFKKPTSELSTDKDMGSQQKESSGLSIVDTDANLKNKNEEGAAGVSIGKSENKDSYSEQELNVRKSKKQKAATEKSIGSSKEVDNLAVSSSDAVLSKDSENEGASIGSLGDQNDSTSLSQLESEHKLKKAGDNSQISETVGQNKESDSLALTDFDSILNKDCSEEASTVGISSEKATAEDSYAESKRKAILKKKSEKQQVSDNLSAADGRHDTTSLSVADSGVSFDKSTENELAASGNMASDVSVKVQDTLGKDAKANLISSFEKPDEESKTSKKLSGKQKTEKSTFAERNASFDLSSKEDDGSVKSNLQTTKDSDSLALQDTDLSFSKPSSSSANAHLDMPQKELTLRICQSETVDWSDDSEQEQGTSTSAPGEVKKKKKFIISAISQDGEFSDAESITFDENGVRVEKRRRKKRDPKEYMGAGELAMRIPAFAKKMQYIGCIEGDVVIFTIKVVSDDVPLIRMYRNDYPVANFDKMAFEGFTKGSEHSFNVTINDIRKLDGGKLVFEAKNDYGVDKCTILLDVRDSGSFIDDYSEIHRSAEIKDPVGDVQVKEGETATLTGKVDGYPLPELIWIKNGREIDMMAPSTKYQLDYHSDGEFEARIANCTFEDDDDYSLLVENLAGVDSCNFQVFVDCKEYPDDEHFNRRRRLQRGRRVVEASSDSELDDAKKRKKRRTKRVVERRNPNAPRLTQLIPPRFDKILSDHDAIVGDNVVMMVETLGEPEPQVRFYRDGKLIGDDSGEKVEVRHEDEMRKHWLILKDICKDEEAEYACQAINVAGEAWCFSDVVVHLSEESRDDDKSIDLAEEAVSQGEKSEAGEDKTKQRAKKKVTKKKDRAETEKQDLTKGADDAKPLESEQVLEQVESETAVQKKTDDGDTFVEKKKKKTSDVKKAKETDEATSEKVAEGKTEGEDEKKADEKAKKEADAKQRAEKKTLKQKKEATDAAPKTLEAKKETSQAPSSRESTPPS